MDDLLSEKEQIEQIRAWWSDYGNYVISGVVLGALVLFGWNYYGSSTLKEQYAVSALYGELTELVVDGEVDEAEVVAGRIFADYADTPYAAQSRLALARLYMDTNRDRDAADALNELLAGPAGNEFKQIARLRLGKVLLYQDKPQEVLDLIDAATIDDAFSARYDELRGDAYVALDRNEDARAAYERSLSESGQAATIDQQFVQLKLLDLPLPAEDEAGELVDDTTEEADIDADAGAVEGSDVEEDSE